MGVKWRIVIVVTKDEERLIARLFNAGGGHSWLSELNVRVGGHGQVGTCGVGIWL